ncbi:MAG: S8 family serine peptidase, partial [Verrucomicrobiota bacterium]
MGLSSHWIDPAEAQQAMEKGRGKGVRIALLDSGLDADHPMLTEIPSLQRKAIIEGAHGFETIDDDEPDAFGHGTAVAYLIHQVAPEAEIWSYKVFEKAGGRRSSPASAL